MILAYYVFQYEQPNSVIDVPFENFVDALHSI